MDTEKKHTTVDESGLQVTSVFAGTGDHAVLNHSADADEEVLVALGYKQEFKRFVCPVESFKHSLSQTIAGVLEQTCMLTLSITEISPSGPPSRCHSLFWVSYLPSRRPWHMTLAIRAQLGASGDGS